MSQSLDSHGDLAYYRALALQARPPVLELGCGEGRVAIALASSGVQCIGLDHDGAAIVNATHRSAAVPEVGWVLGDMRRPPLTGPFGLILMPYRSFAYLTDEASQQATLAGVRELLGPGGRLALDLFNPGAADLVSQSLAGRPATRSGGRRTVSPDGPALSLLTRLEMESLLLGAGFQIEALHGGFSGAPFHEGATTMVWLARRA